MNKCSWALTWEMTLDLTKYVPLNCSIIGITTKHVPFWLLHVIRHLLSYVQSKLPCVCIFPSATNLCFQEKSVYTQEVLAIVLQQLLEQTPLPVLFMRTVSVNHWWQNCAYSVRRRVFLYSKVLQSLGICPKLLSFVMTILVKLISKQVG